MPWLPQLGLFALAMLLASAITPLVIRLCERHNVLDLPGGRKQHGRGVPRLGGVSVFCALSLGLTVAVYGVLGNHLDVAPQQARLIPVIYAGLCGFFLIGFLDDLSPLPARWRLLAQLAVATGVVLLAGGTALRVTSLFGRYPLPDWLSIVLTVLWIAGVVNTFNWIDGLDGLASGIACISALAFYSIALLKPGLPNAGLAMAICACLCGALVGFLRYNFQPARIFLGDGGAYSVGYLLAVVSIIGLFKTAAAISFALPVAILLLPIGDTFFAILRRLVKGQPVTEADDKHVHHRMLGWVKQRLRQRLARAGQPEPDEQELAGKAQRSAVLALYAFAGLFATLAVWIGSRS